MFRHLSCCRILKNVLMAKEYLLNDNNGLANVLGTINKKSIIFYECIRSKNFTRLFVCSELINTKSSTDYCRERALDTK